MGIEESTPNQPVTEKKKKEKHEFWNEQPVKQFSESEPEEAKEVQKIDKSKHQDPTPLPKEFKWKIMDVKDKETMEIVYNFLKNHYVSDSQFRFAYSIETLEWAMCPPGYLQELHLGILDESNNLIGFITGIPQYVSVSGNEILATDVNFLCVHEKFREKNLAPRLIKEVTRRSYINDIYYGTFTAGILIPTPFGRGRYYHRDLNVAKLVEINYSYIPSKFEKSENPLEETEQFYSVEKRLKNTRKFCEKDIPSAMKLVNNYLSKFKYHLIFKTEEGIILFPFILEFGHWFLPRKDVVETLVIENEQGEITDISGYFVIPSTFLKPHDKYSVLNAGYLWYSVFTTVKPADLVNDVMNLAKENGMDVFNVLNIMDNGKFLAELKFDKGGCLNYYLFNYVNPSVESKDIGLVMI